MGAVSELDTDGITPAASALTYNILEEGSCVSDLLDAQFGTGRSATEVDLTFNSFTFEAADDELALKCNVKLCLTTDDDCNKSAQKMTVENLDSSDTVNFFECDAKYTPQPGGQAFNKLSTFLLRNRNNVSNTTQA